MTPSSSSGVPAVSSPSASAVGWPSASTSRFAPNVAPVATCRAPSSAKNVGYGEGASPKSSDPSSGSVIVPVPVSERSVSRVPNAVAVLKLAVKVSLNSTMLSLLIATVTVWSVVLPAGNVTWSAAES